MTFAKLKQKPIQLGKVEKHAVSTQFGALCYRVKNGKPQILLITSRNTKRWILPKGWPIDKMTPAESAAQEAFEEAGAKGRVAPVCLGIYSYTKVSMPGDPAPCVVALFPLKVEALSDRYPEAGQRRRKWFSRKKAAAVVKQPELAAIIRNFDPSALPR